jgi:predicted permease
MNGLLQDLRYTIRQLTKNPGFTAAAVLMLALGIGATTAIFSIVEGVVLAPLPYKQPDRLVAIWQNNLTLKRIMSVSSPDFRDWQGNVRFFQQMAAFRLPQGFDLTNPGLSEHIEGSEISSDFFSTLGVKLALGREFSPQEDRQGGAPVAIISSRLWKDQFASSPAALGKFVTVNGVDRAIVGILPAEYHLIGNTDVCIPMAQEDPLTANDRTVHPGILAIARLKPGMSIAQAQAEMSALQNHLNELYPQADQGLGIDVVPLKQLVVGDLGRTLVMLWGAVGLVLLITCANVANLLLARSAGRSREFAICSALGANRVRLIRQLFTESVLLSLSGGALGVLVALSGTKPLVAVLSGYLPRSENIAVNAHVLLFTFGASLVAGILFGLAPALKSWNPDLQGSLKEGSRGSVGSHHRAQNGLVIVQMALTLMLLACAGLLFRTIRHLWEVNPGFEAQHVITFKVGLSPAEAQTGSSIRIAYRQLVERIRQIPGVQAADLTALVPMSQRENAGPFLVGSQKPTSSAEAPRGGAAL